MPVLIGIAIKSLVIGGLTLGLLHLMRKRSAAERSWVAHIGLLALMILAFAPLVLPSWNVEAPAVLGRDAAPEITQPAIARSSGAPITRIGAPAPTDTAAAKAPEPVSRSFSIDPVEAATAAYAVPAAILLFVTFLALVRLVALQARAEVLVDGHWLSALARAQRRMGFKHGTALLTSNELASPISWGLMRPVIVLNNRAIEATDEAEAIIAHELAHVARFDWIKLLLARIATALFWFNPLVWLLAREAHQLREESADDTVLAADIADTDYAQLLVGVARHDCPSLLLGAHGVAPSKSSLARRVARVLDGKSVRGPVARTFALAVFVAAIAVAAPLAALTLVPGATSAATSKGGVAGVTPGLVVTAEAPASLPSMIAKGVSTSFSTAVAAASTATGGPDVLDRAKIARRAAREAAAEARSSDREARVAVSEAQSGESQQRMIKVKFYSISPEYVGAMRAAAPRLANLDYSEFAGLHAVGVTPDYARALAAAGFASISADELRQARAVGVTGDYVRALRQAGVRGGLDDFVELRAVGIDPAFIIRVKRSGAKSMSADDIVQMHALSMPRSVTPPAVPAPPPPPSRKGRPAASPPSWNPPDDGG